MTAPGESEKSVTELQAEAEELVKRLKQAAREEKRAHNAEKNAERKSAKQEARRAHRQGQAQTPEETEQQLREKEQAWSAARLRERQSRGKACTICGKAVRRVMYKHVIRFETTPKLAWDSFPDRKRHPHW